jgi:hypothetical protein
MYSGMNKPLSWKKEEEDNENEDLKLEDDDDDALYRTINSSALCTILVLVIVSDNQSVEKMSQVQVTTIINETVYSECENISAGSLFPGRGRRILDTPVDELTVELNSLQDLQKSLSVTSVPLLERLRDTSFSPASLRSASASNQVADWTWLGTLDRFELVKSCQRSSCARPEGWGELMDRELEFVVLAHELGEQLLLRNREYEAAMIFEQVLSISPADVLGYLKLGLSLMKCKCSASKVIKKADLYQLARDMHVIEMFKFAIMIEPSNKHLRSVIDIFIRILADAPVNDRLLTAEVPRSVGIDMCLLSMLQLE